ncbi:NLR family CARD domain-containing protein 3-like [Sardina pilchardus]|uniref:NLR family CARD domain-containing protein 3-like n=1 Tax=Sardina pilchardus TaxID=27697 RepID=UPI002E1002F2
MRPSTGHSELRADLTQDQSMCGVCEQVLRDQVVITCGHSFCRQCISSYWGQCPERPCPQCGKRLRTSSSISSCIEPSTHTHSPTQHPHTHCPTQRSHSHPAQHSQTAMGPLLLHRTQSPLPYLQQTSPAPYHHSPDVRQHSPMMEHLQYMRGTPLGAHGGYCSHTDVGPTLGPNHGTIERSSLMSHHSVSANITAHTGSQIIAPIITGCHIGSLSFKEAPKAPDEAALRKILEKHKTTMLKKVECICENFGRKKEKTALDSIYTDLYITEGERDEVNNQHEVWQIDQAARRQTSCDTPIDCNDIFRALPGQRGHIRTVMTKGIAGIGKTVSVQKFVLDWAEGRANQDLNMVLLLPFRDLNLLRDEPHSLHELLFGFHQELNPLRDTLNCEDFKILVIFDGLDESRLPLNFQSNLTVLNATKITSVDALITSLIKGNLLSSAFIWITSRPAAAGQIPDDYVDRYTEVQGFGEQQKEEYFRRKFSDPSEAARVISHLKRSKTLFIMCHIPVFCWITSTVLKEILKQDGDDIPKSLTEIYIFFLLIQTNMKSQKYSGGKEKLRPLLLASNSDMIVRLAELAFKQLQKGNLLFYENDLEECGIDVSEASVYSGMCTEILKEDSRFFETKMYCFVHLSFQEFLSAFFVFHSYVNKQMDVLSFFLDDQTQHQAENLPLHDFLISAVDRALESKTGHLDLFLRFLMGISLESNQKLLQGLLPTMLKSQESMSKTMHYIKYAGRDHHSPDRCINLLHCLAEMNDETLHEEIQRHLRSKNHPERFFQPGECSAIAYMLLLSEEVMEEFDMKEYKSSAEGHRRLVPMVRCCRKARLVGCELTHQSVEIVASVLHSAGSPLRELDLSENRLLDQDLDLLSRALKSPECKLWNISLRHCWLRDRHCEALASVLGSGVSCLRELDLSDNDLQDTGVKTISSGIRSPQCKLEVLRLSFCGVTEDGCAHLAEALDSNPFSLRELDLSFNYPGDAGARLLFCRREDPLYKLETLNVDHGAVRWLKSGLRKYTQQLTLDPNTVNSHLSLSEGNRKATCGYETLPYPDHPERLESRHAVLAQEALSGRCYWEAEWFGGGANIGVTYKSIVGKGDGNYSCFGSKSWILEHNQFSCQARHDNQVTLVTLPPPTPPSHRVGVYLDCPEGSVSFYVITSDTPVHLHTFLGVFPEPLYAAFLVHGGSLVLGCQ